MKTLAALLLFAVFAAIAATAFAPATLADAQVARATGGALRVVNARGTIWQGSGQLMRVEGDWRAPLRWQLSPLGLLEGTLRVVLGDGDQALPVVQGRARIDRSTLAVEDLLLALPAAVANVESPVTMVAGGEIAVRTPRMVMDDTAFDGSVAIEWRQARIAASGFPVLWLGTVTANLTGRGDAIAGPLEARRGDVEADGTIELRARNARVDLRVRPHPSAPVAVREALSRLGSPDASGAIALRFVQPLR